MPDMVPAEDQAFFRGPTEGIYGYFRPAAVAWAASKLGAKNYRPAINYDE